MKSNRRKSKSRATPKAVLGGLSRLRNHPRPSDENSQPPTHPHSIKNAGILRGPDTQALRLPHALAEAGEFDQEGSDHWWAPGPVVLTIAALAILFICLLAWLVSQMPEK